MVVLGVVTTAAVMVPLAPEIPIAISLVPVILVVALFWVVLRMQTVVRLGADEVRIRVAGVFSTTIPYRQITGVAPDRTTGLREGMGLRLLSNRTTGYLVGGPSVRINTSSGTAVLVSSNMPQDLSKAISRHL